MSEARIIRYKGTAGSSAVFPNTEKRLWKIGDAGVEVNHAEYVDQGHFEYVEDAADDAVPKTKKKR